MSNGFSPPVLEDDFTDSIYVARVHGAEGLGRTSNGDAMLLAPATEEDSVYEADTALRGSAIDHIIPDESLTGTSYTGDGIWLEDFPSDEDVLAKLRTSTASTIKIDGKVVDKKDLTSDNFTVRWYTMKYSHYDGWRIDGVLVAKTARLVVKKTFSGSNDAIQAVKAGGFNISVEHESSGVDASASSAATQEAVLDYTLTLDSTAEAPEGKTGYTSYDAQTDTYTWVIDGRQGRTYSVHENSFAAPDPYHNTCLYKISNSESATNGWLTYSDTSEINVTLGSYASDLPLDAYQTVSFNNLYTQVGTINVWKVDAVTHDGIAGVSFNLSTKDGWTPPIYCKPGTAEYSTDSAALSDGYEEVSSIETDASGRFSMHLSSAQYTTYYLSEETPLGYKGPQNIEMKLTADGDIEYATPQNTHSDVDEPKDGWIEVAGGRVLTIKNVSKEYTSAKAVKDWGSTSEDAKLPVVVQLCRNGVPLSDIDGASFKQTLSADNNWTYEWNCLPLFTDGDLAEYSLREVQIGDVSYDPKADSDGYENYQVSFAAPVYWERADGKEHETAYWDEGSTRHFSDHMRLTVYNTVSKGLISLSKVDEKSRALAGAVFRLYSDAACSNELQSVTSAENGAVTFDAVPTGIYYLKETGAPAGYKFDADVLYKAQVTGSGVTITKITADGTEDKTPITSITNTFGAAPKVQKRDVSGNPLAGAEFTLYKKADAAEDANAAASQGVNGSATQSADGAIGAFGDPFITDENGAAFFDGELQDGTYYLKETRAPNGFCSLQSEATINVQQGVVSVQLPDDGYWDYAGLAEGSKTCTFTVVNDILYNLPTTGGVGVVRVTLVAIALMATAMVGLFRRDFAKMAKRRKRGGMHA